MKIKSAPARTSELSLQVADKKHGAKMKGVEIRPLGEGSYKTIKEVLLVEKKHEAPKPRALAISRHDSEENLKHECKISQKLTAAHTQNIVHMQLVKFRKKHNNKSVAALMPLCTGGHLSSYIAGHPDLSLHERMRLADELTVAVDGMHKKHLCHLDLKEENVLIQVKKDGIPHVKLGDFGTTERIGRMTFGCGSFPAPEMHTQTQYREKISIAPPLDLWPLGSILLNLKHKTTPLRTMGLSWGSRLDEVTFRFRATQVSQQTERFLTLSGDEADLTIAQLLSTEPEKRPPAERVHAVFQKWLSEHP